MHKTYCDRCKKDLGNLKCYELVNLTIEDLKEYATNNEKGIYLFSARRKCERKSAAG